MSTDPCSSSNGFSLKRLLEEQAEVLVKKRKKTPISLSKSRGLSSSSSSVSSSNSNSPDIYATATKQKVKIKDEQEVKIKDEQVEIYTVDDYLTIKTEFKSNPDEYELLSDVKSETKDVLLSHVESDIKTEKENEYGCPICNKDLTNVKSSYLRQRHVDTCISNNNDFGNGDAKPKLEFDMCVFCGQNLSHLDSSDRRQAHLNRCLDESIVTPEQDTTFAGQEMPLLVALEMCPVCFKSFGQGSGHRQKIIHLKQCAKQNQIPVSELLKRIECPVWDHAPLTTGDNKPDTTLKQKPQHTLVAHGYDLVYTNDKDDKDFSNEVIIHKRSAHTTAHNLRKNDQEDEALQTALALSKSVQEEKRQIKRLAKRRQRLTNERDWNSANIWSSEESRLKAIAALDDILFPPSLHHYQQVQRERSIGLLGPSRLHTSDDNFFWHLASNQQSNWDRPLIFMSSFLRKLKGREF
ncbi:MAG: hypothetical protein EXX96DRAFT_568373 [Benjaminiella poitrasii]|nr:MAG: hypothetical protein EXX96DRAFT_568373 [Benjaminiella poitrasii]